MKGRLAALILLIVACIGNAVAQQQDTVLLKQSQILVLKDSVFIPNGDTTLVIPSDIRYRIKPNPYIKSEAFYEKLKNKSEKNRISHELYAMLVRDTTRNVLDNSKGIKSEQYFEEYEGFRIKKITVQRIQMITGNVNDTLRSTDSHIIRAINQSHRKTRSKLIENNLLFNVGDPVDPFLIADSERILRQYGFINDARIYMLPSLEEDMAVEVIIAVQDRFPWRLNVDYSSLTKYNFTVAQQNIAGSGHEVYAGYFHSKDGEPVNGFSTGYITAPLGNTFARAEIFIEDSYKRETQGVSVNKPFVSPVIRWGGRFEAFGIRRDVEFDLGDSTYEEDFDLNVIDLWIARAWRPFRNERKSITLGIRSILNEFNERPEVGSDSNSVFHDRNSHLVALDYHKSNFIKTANIRSIGITEDLPVGYSFGTTLGGNFSEFADEWYLGLRMQWNNLFSLGYLSAYGEVGGFRNKSGWSQALLETELSYMSPMISMGLNKFRSFVTINYINSRDLSLPLTVKLGDYIDGLNGYYTQGNEAFILSFEGVLFARWYWYGFRFAPFAGIELGQVRESRLEENYREVYPAFGGGFRITNPGLIISSLEVASKVFTNVPENGDALYFSISLSIGLPFRINRSEIPVILPYSKYNYLR